ncbi:ectoine hydrolase-like [Bolinopsis microptera]|uniref:ectoine hydrolase-like n=1 Tax=Bolinopsis microptera TaxID=2820187 RepID=UPI00307A6154
MSEEKVDLMILSNMEHIFYLSNYQTVGGCVQVLLVTQDDIHIVTRELEATNAEMRSHVAYSFYDESQDPIDIIASTVKGRYGSDTATIIGLEFNTTRLAYNQVNQLQKELLKIFPRATFSDISLQVSRLRLVKSPLEISNVKRAAGIVHAGLQAGIGTVCAGMMETEVGGKVLEKMCREGCEYTAYPVFLCSGETGCMGHYTPTQMLVQEHDIVFFEIGGCFKRYHAARMYSVYVGDEVPEWFTAAEKLIRKAVSVGRQMMKPGVAAKEVDAAMRDIISHYPYPHKQSERAGYSIGIGFYTDWSNSQFFIHPTSEELFQENMTIHLIPWIQLPGKGAVGFSDTVLVTSQGGESLFEGHFYKRGDKWV